MISIILPCFRPPTDWQDVIVAAISNLKKTIAAEIELIIVDDGNTDKTVFQDLTQIRDTVSTFNFISYKENQGKGYALRKGVEAAKGDLVVYTDIDLPYTTESIINVIRQLESGTDVVIGIKDMLYYKRVPKVRKVISKALRYFIRLFLQIPITDTQCGLKGFNKKAKPIFLATTINRYLFDLEFVKLCYRTSAPTLAVVALPISLKENIIFRKMNNKILIQESINFLKVLYRKRV